MDYFASSLADPRLGDFFDIEYPDYIILFVLLIEKKVRLEVGVIFNKALDFLFSLFGLTQNTEKRSTTSLCRKPLKAWRTKENYIQEEEEKKKKKRMKVLTAKAGSFSSK